MAKKHNSQKTLWKLGRWKIAGAAVVLLVLGLTILSYSNFYPPLVDKKYIFALDSFFASIPVLPKTPKQIMTKSLYSDKSLGSYSALGRVSLRSASNEEITLSFVGKANNAGLFGSSSLVGVKGTVYGQANGEVDFTTVAKGDQLFFRTKGNLGFEDFDPTLLGGGWYQIDLNKFQAGIGVAAKEDSEIVVDISSQAQQFLESFIDKGSFSRVTKVETLKIEGKEFYQINMAIDPELLRGSSLLKGYKFTKPKLSLLINKKTFFLEKLNLETVVLPEQAGLLQQKMGLRFEYQLLSINQNQKIETPKVDKVIESPIDLSLAFDGKTGLGGEDLFTAAQKSVDRGQNFLTIERILRVILLLPKAFYSN